MSAMERRRFNVNWDWPGACMFGGAASAAALNIALVIPQLLIFIIPGVICGSVFGALYGRSIRSHFSTKNMCFAILKGMGVALGATIAPCFVFAVVSWYTAMPWYMATFLPASPFSLTDLAKAIVIIIIFPAFFVGWATLPLGAIAGWLLYHCYPIRESNPRASVEIKS